MDHAFQQNQAPGFFLFFLCPCVQQGWSPATSPLHPPAAASAPHCPLPRPWQGAAPIPSPAPGPDAHMPRPPRVGLFVVSRFFVGHRLPPLGVRVPRGRLRKGGGAQIHIWCLLSARYHVRLSSGSSRRSFPWLVSGRSWLSPSLPQPLRFSLCILSVCKMPMRRWRPAVCLFKEFVSPVWELGGRSACVHSASFVPPSLTFSSSLRPGSLEMMACL